MPLPFAFALLLRGYLSGCKMIKKKKERKKKHFFKIQRKMIGTE